MSDIAGEGPLSPGEIAELFHVTPTTVSRWAKQGRLPSIRTLGGPAGSASPTSSRT